MSPLPRFTRRVPRINDCLLFSLGAWRAQYMGLNWGLPVRVLAGWTDPCTDVEAVSVSLLYDTPVRPNQAQLRRLEEGLAYG